MKEIQYNDPNFKKVIDWVQLGKKFSWEEISSTSETCKDYWVRYDSLIIKNAFLYHKWEDVNPKLQVVLPLSKVLKKIKRDPRWTHWRSFWF